MPFGTLWMCEPGPQRCLGNRTINVGGDQMFPLARPKQTRKKKRKSLGQERLYRERITDIRVMVVDFVVVKFELQKIRPRAIRFIHCVCYDFRVTRKKSIFFYLTTFVPIIVVHLFDILNGFQYKFYKTPYAIVMQERMEITNRSKTHYQRAHSGILVSRIIEKSTRKDKLTFIA